VTRSAARPATSGARCGIGPRVAYNAALQAATPALAATGYRASRDQHHYRVIQSLRETVGADLILVNTLETFRKKRDITGYERVGSVSDAEADAMRALAVQLRDVVTTWLGTHHAHLLAG
jgi:hypothetical protein